jgi:hypothetical protein
MADQDYFSQFAAAPAPRANAPAVDPFAEFELPSPAPAKESGVNPWAVGAGALGVGALALATHNPALLKTVGNGLAAARKTSMLSGLAPIKSALGNVGGAAMGSIERGSLAPLREMLSPQTAREAIEVFKRGPNTAIAGPAANLSKWNLPGRVMGAMDEAGQNALQRAGYSAADSASEMLQAPLPKSVSSAFENPVMDFLVPFRKTPFNALVEGARTFKADTLGKKVALGTSMATGALAGQAEDPKTIGITTAAHGRYGLPHAMAAGASRAFFGGNQKQAKDVIDAAGDFGGAGQGVVQLATEPVESLGKTVTSPALFSLLKYLGLKD